MWATIRIQFSLCFIQFNAKNVPLSITAETFAEQVAWSIEQFITHITLFLFFFLSQCGLSYTKSIYLNFIWRYQPPLPFQKNIGVAVLGNKQESSIRRINLNRTIQHNVHSTRNWNFNVAENRCFPQFVFNSFARCFSFSFHFRLQIGVNYSTE